jgi:Na+-driven multidrug efflux pump
MPKFMKETTKTTKSKKKKDLEEKFAHRSVIVSGIASGILLCLSFLFNGEIIDIFMNQNEILTVIDVVLKVSIILFFFFFSMVSIGNYRELIGKPSNWRDLLLIICISLVQTFRNPFVFLFSSIGICLILIYMYFVQE